MKDGLHEPFHDPVENIQVGAHEIDFKVMDEGIDGAACGLVGTNGKGLCGIEKRGRGIERRIAEEGLLPGFDIVDYAKAVHIRPRAGYGRDGHDGQKFFHLRPASEKIPAGAIVKNSGACQLRAVCDAAAAHGEEHVYVFVPADSGSAVYCRMPRVGFHAAHFKKRQTGGFDLFQDGGIERRRFQPLAPVDEQNAAAVLRELSTQFLNLVVFEKNVSRNVVFEIRVVHEVFLLSKGLLWPVLSPQREIRHPVPEKECLILSLFVQDCVGMLRWTSRKTLPPGA